MRKKTFIGICLILLSTSTLAQSVGSLSSEYCGTDDEQNGVLKSGKNIETQCVLAFANNEETEAVISLEGKVLTLQRIDFKFTSGYRNKSQPSLGNRHKYIFLSKDKATKVTLLTRVTDSSCYVDTESCCGDSYEGTLTVERKGVHVKIPVEYYRGG